MTNRPWTHEQAALRSGEKSSYRTGTIQDAADSFVRDLVDNFNNGEVDNEYHYGVTNRRVEAFTIAGGGPGAELVFVLDSDGSIDGCYLDYVEPSGRAFTPIHPGIARELYEALQFPPLDDDAEDDKDACTECGEPMFVTDDGIAHHRDDDTPDGIDHDADEDHVALRESEED